MNCNQLSILQITDGTTVVDLLDERSGFLLKEWVPQTAEFKDGGIFQDSPLAQGRRLVAYRYANVVETMAVTSRHEDADALIRDTQTLRRLLQKAADYWATDWQNTPVYVVARGKGESNTRYCIIQQGRLGTDGNPYAQPFMQPSGSGRAVFDDQPLIFERGDWLSEEPGSTVDVTATNEQEWGTPEDWEVETTTPVGNITALCEIVGGVNDGALYAGTDSNARVYISTDGGATWSLQDTLGAGASDRVEKIYQLRTVPDEVRVLVSGDNSTDGAYYSDDGGQTLVRTYTLDWYDVAQSAYSDMVLYVLEGGRYFLETADRQSLKYITYTTGSPGRVVEIPENGDWVITWADDIYVVNDIITSGGLELSHGSSQFNCLIVLDNGRILAGMSDGTVYKSDDLGDNWATVTTTLTGGAYSFVQVSDGTVYAGGDGVIWKSLTSGETWVQNNTDPTDDVSALLIKANGDLYAGDDGRILSLLASNLYSVEGNYVINSHPIGVITNIKNFDDSSATFTDLFPNPTLPYAMWPEPPQILDLLYIGCNEAAGSLPVSSVVFNLVSGSRAWDIGFQYWNGSTWTALNVAKRRALGPDGYWSKLGAFLFSWDVPSDWATTTIDGVTGRWLRSLTAWSSGATVSPHQGTQNMYALRNAYVEIPATSVLGDIPALARIEIENQSNFLNFATVRFGSFGRAIIGLRSVGRGTRFNAYLNASDAGNDPLLLVSAGTDTTFGDDITSPSTRRAVYSPTGTGSWVDVVTFTFSGGLVEHYYGAFHVFLRCRQSGGSAGQILFRMRSSTGSGGVQIDTTSRTLSNTNEDQFIDFGRLTLPVSSLQAEGEAGDEASITIQCNASSTTPDIHFFDLVLIPVDEWLGDFTDQANAVMSPITNDYYLDVDSATFPKRSVRAQVRHVETGRIKNSFQPATNGEAILQANAAQRLWFFFARTESAGSSDWRSEPFASAKITLKANQRYLSMRGDR
jgi:hypothetical protein